MSYEYNDHIGQAESRHRRACGLGYPITVDPAITLSRLTPLTWQAGNHQHYIDNGSLAAIDYGTAVRLNQNQPSVNLADNWIDLYMVK